MLYVQEQWVDETMNLGCGDSDVYESRYDKPGDLFRACLREHGRCVSKVFIGEGSEIQPIGWVFQKRARYEDTNEPYLLLTWVTVHEQPPTETIEYHYARF